ncbi:MAG: glycosyltransferase family 39 protein [Actinobacteria bacterium]|nr:glycosyltransferase family 39 protein [Actinomycetota bacterium]
MSSSGAATGARAGSRTFVRAIPSWAWLLGLVALSTLVRYGLGRRAVAPWIFIDELIYSELAKSFAEGGSFAIRDVPVGWGYGVLYPLLISPAYRLFDAVPDAYAAAKAINAFVISLAALPAYGLARRVLGHAPSLVAAVLAVALPSLLYAGTLMTENLFYPLFLLAALLLVLVLERPSLRRVLALLAVVGLAFATRAQAVVVLPAIVTAPVLLVLLDGGGVRRLGAFRSLYGLLAGGAVALAVVQWLRGTSPLAVLGAYRAAGEESYDPHEVLRWLLYHLAELDLSLGWLPFAAMLLLLGQAGRLRQADRVFLAASLSLAGWLLLQVSAFASRHSLRIEERNMFYVAPLFLIALLVWSERGLPRQRFATAVALVAAAVLPALLPFPALIGVSAVSDTFGLLPWWDIHHEGVPLDRVWLAVLLAGAAACSLLVLLPRVGLVLLPALLLAFFALSSRSVEDRTRTASIGSLFQGITRPERDWVDRAVGGDARVVAIWSGSARVEDDLGITIKQNEFFSQSVDRVLHVAEPVPGGLPQTPVRFDSRDGLLRDPEGRAVRAPYVLGDDSLRLAGSEITRDKRKGLALLRTDGPVRTSFAVSGLYDDAWSGATLSYRRYRCRGGSVRVLLESDPNLFRKPQTVVGRGAGVRRALVPPSGRASLSVPLRRRPGTTWCVARFRVSPTAVPARIQRGSTDTRRLGARFVRFAYRP